MKKASKVALLLLLTALTVLLSGCVKNELALNVDPDGGGTFIYVYRVEKGIADEYFPPGFAEDCLYEEIDGKLYYCKSNTVTVGSYAELEEALLTLPFIVEDGTCLFSEAVIREDYIRLFTASDLIPGDIVAMAEQNGIDIYDHVTLEVAVTMPYWVETSSLGDLSSDGYGVTAVVEDLSRSHVIELECVKPFVFPVVSVAVACVCTLLVAGATWVILEYVKRRRLKRAEAMPDLPVDQI